MQPAGHPFVEASGAAPPTRSLGLFGVAKPDHSDQRARGRAEAEGQIVPDPDHSPAEVESVFGEDVNVRGRLQRRDTPAARNRDVKASTPVGTGTLFVHRDRDHDAAYPVTGAFLDRPRPR